MARGSRVVPPCCKRYGSPLFCAAWIPTDKIIASAEEEELKEAERRDEGGEGKLEEEEQEKEKGGKTEKDPKRCNEWMVVLGGGGGEGRSGVPNAVLISQFDPTSRSLSNEPIFRIGMEEEVPYRMAVHPAGDGIVCSFPKRCRWFEWSYLKRNGSLVLKSSDNLLSQLEDVGLQLALTFNADGSLLAAGGERNESLVLKSSDNLLSQLEDVGLQLALTFNADGSLLAAGGENGHLRVFKWPSMDLILDKSDVHASVKDLDFSTDGKFLVSLGDSGPCRVWDTTSCSVVASLQRESDENFRFCRFSQRVDNQILYIIAMQGERGRVVSWDPASWNRITSKEIVRDPISAFSVSADGKLLAVGTSEGDVVITNSLNMRKVTEVKKAHLGLVTTLVFKDSRALVSTSFDGSARVTVIGGTKENGSSSAALKMFFVIFVIILAILVYYMKKTRSLMI